MYRVLTLIYLPVIFTSMEEGVGVDSADIAAAISASAAAAAAAVATHNNQIEHGRRGVKMVRMDKQTTERMNERTNEWMSE
jgi:hypothetical protein